MGNGEGNQGCAPCDPNSADGTCSTNSEGVCANGFGGTAVGSQCVACADGKYKTAAGNIECASCDEHSVNCGESSAGVCIAGYGSIDNGVTCNACGADTYKASSGNDECIAVLPGHFASVDGIVYTSGTATKSVMCPANTYSLHGQGECSSCAEHSVNCGGSSAGVCNAGYGSNDNGVTCIACPEGKHKSNTGNTDCTTNAPVSAPTSVPPPTGTVLQCGAGLYVKDKYTAHESCAQCPAGKFSTHRTMRNRRCKQCRVNMYAAYAGASSCTACPEDFHTKGRRGRRQCYDRTTGQSMKQLGMIQ